MLRSAFIGRIGAARLSKSPVRNGANVSMISRDASSAANLGDEGRRDDSCDHGDAHDVERCTAFIVCIGKRPNWWVCCLPKTRTDPAAVLPRVRLSSSPRCADGRRTQHDGFEDVFWAPKPSANATAWHIRLDALTVTGFVDPKNFYESPYTDIDSQGIVGVFPKEQAKQIIEIVKGLNAVEAA